MSVARKCTKNSDVADAASRRYSRSITARGELRLVKGFAHYTGGRREEIRKRFSRVHDDVLYEKRL